MSTHTIVTNSSVSERFSRQRTRDTQPELKLRRELWSQGVRYRVAYPVPGKQRRSIDVALPSRMLAVFVDGCFWHGCPAHLHLTPTNNTWWQQKIESNRQRDQETNDHLAALGWTVLRIWEHEDLEARASEIIDLLSQRRC